jgi:copper homeostasis protein CutC
MSTQFTQGDYLDMFTEFSNQLQKTHAEMIENWHDPMGVTMNSFFDFAEMANDAVDQIAQQHTARYFPQATDNPAHSCARRTDSTVSVFSTRF